MYLDAFTISALVDEFLDVIVGGRVQDSIDVDESGLGLEIYANHQRRYLYISADLQMPRVHLVEDKLRRGLAQPKTVGLLFRRYVEGGIITHVSQPPWERVILIDVAGPQGEVTIIVEPMERRSNILLVQAGVILDCMRRVGPEDNRYRLSLPAHEYVPPPPQTGKLTPDSVTESVLDNLLEQNDDPKRPLHRLLSGSILGLSPLLAKEVVYRASGDANARSDRVDLESLNREFRVVIIPLLNRVWNPGIVETEEGITAFSVYPIESMVGWQPAKGVSDALSAYYGSAVGEDAYNAAKAPIGKAIDDALGKLSGKLASLQRSMTDESDREELRKSGELILAYQYTLQKGQNELQAQYEPDAPAMVIVLDSNLTPMENAQRYFGQYEKAKRALEDVPGLIEGTRAEIAYLSQLKMDLELAASWPEIDEVQQVLQARGYWRGKRAGRMGGGKSAPIKYVTHDGFTLWIGRNSRQNEIVTFDKGGSADLWLHARDVPGAHVVIKFDGRPIPETVIERAAEIAAFYSTNRGEANVIVDVTECKYVKKIKGSGPGMVTYRNETTRTVSPRGEAE